MKIEQLIEGCKNKGASTAELTAKVDELEDRRDQLRAMLEETREKLKAALSEKHDTNAQAEQVQKEIVSKMQSITTTLNAQITQLKSDLETCQKSHNDISEDFKQCDKQKIDFRIKLDKRKAQVQNLQDKLQN